VADRLRAERIQMMLSAEELTAIDDFRFKHRLPSRAAALREALRRGLSAEGQKVSTVGAQSSDFGVLRQRQRKRP
jgi:metal-responsive CopG/Arc/MetJ family transcriptional regulator